MEITRRSNYNLNPRKLGTISLPKPQSGCKWKHTDSPQWFFIRSSIYQFSFEDNGDFAVYDKDCRNVWTPSMPGMRSAEYQSTIPLQVLIIIHNYANVWRINQSNHYPVFGSWGHWTALTAGRFRRCWKEKTAPSNRLKFRVVRTDDFVRIKISWMHR